MGPGGGAGRGGQVAGLPRVASQALPPLRTTSRTLPLSYLLQCPLCCLPQCPLCCLPPRPPTLASLHALPPGHTFTEVQIDEELTARRAAQPGFVEPSFPTIAGAAACLCAGLRWQAA